MRRFIIWNDTWRWSHSSHLLKINFAKVKPFIKSCRDAVQIPHMAPRTLHTTLHRCYCITWQHYRRMWWRAKVNRVVVWFIQRWYILKASSSHSNSAACCLLCTVLLLWRQMWGRLQMALIEEWQYKWITDMINNSNLYEYDVLDLHSCLQTVAKWPKVNLP